MIKVTTFSVGELDTNCYVVADTESKKCLIIDLGGGFLEINDYILKQGYTLCALLLTHGHFDHILDAHRLTVPVYISEADRDFLKDASLNLGGHFGIKVSEPKIIKTFNEGILKIDGFSVKVFNTPGHTKGSACFLIGDNLFSGDTLFDKSFGRTDFPTGSYKEICSSVNMLLHLEKDYTVYPGHGAKTTIFEQKKYNPLFKESI